MYTDQIVYKKLPHATIARVLLFSGQLTFFMFEVFLFEYSRTGVNSPEISILCQK